MRLVRAYKTSTGARVAISLRANTDYQVTNVGDKQIQVDVTVPAQMLADRQIAAQGFSTVSPSTGDAGRSPERLRFYRFAGVVQANHGRRNTTNRRRVGARWGGGDGDRDENGYDKLKLHR